jgi:peptidoglycan/xylan/chitin deacetylase (PgdA/CDA1 family)
MRFLSFLIFVCLSAFGYWGFDAKGVVTHFKTSEKTAALTLDACGGSVKSCGYDKALIDFLRANKIPATLFVSAKWIDANKKLYMELINDPNFDVQNHGTRHVPLSMEGKSAYGIKGTNGAEEVKAEVMTNHEKVKAMTGKVMTLFRAGTAHYDDESVAIVNSLGYKVIGFAINADAGATNSVAQIAKELSKTKSGDIIIAHMNHPESHNSEGLSKALKKMQDNGWKFVKVADALK